MNTNLREVDFSYDHDEFVIMNFNPYTYHDFLEYDGFRHSALEVCVHLCLNDNLSSAQYLYELKPLTNIFNWPKVNKVLPQNARNRECPISYELINKNNSYCSCTTCSYNFLYKTLEKALLNNFECPMCRADWTDKTVYINGAKPELKKKKTVNSDKKIESNSSKSFNEVKKTSRAEWSDETIYINKLKNKINYKKFVKTNKSDNELTKTKHNKRFFYGK